MIQITLQKTFLMFIYTLIGMIMFKKGKITEEGSKTIANILIYLVFPVIIIKALAIPREEGDLKVLGISLILGLSYMFMSVAVAKLIFPKDNLCNCGACFGNVGFFGVPLIASLLGSKAVFFSFGLIMAANMLQWTYGVYLITNDVRQIKPKNVLLNQFTISTLIGLLIFVTNTSDKIPAVFYLVLEGISEVNAPLAMFVIGVYLAQSDLKEVFSNIKFYEMNAVRLVLIPIITIFILRFIPISYDMKMTFAIMASVPVGSNLAIYAQMFGKDYRFGCLVVTQSAILILLTMPLMAGLAQTLFLH